MAMELVLYHQIGQAGDDSAAVRQFLVESGLTDLVEFKNIHYDGAREELRELLGQVESPVLVADKKRVLRGRSAIIDWLKTNVLCLRD